MTPSSWFVLSAAAIAAVAGCATQSATVSHEAPAGGPIRTVRIESCENRTEYTARDLGAEATRLLAEKIAAAGVFILSGEAELVLTCDVESFVEGSALRRWILPGWGTTHAQVAVVVWEQPGQRLLTTLRSKGSVSSGGLYTAGADRYILAVAVDEVVGQLHQWAADAGRRP